MTTPSTSAPATTASSSGNGQTYRGPFAIMTVLFFMWGFMTVFNDILIPRLKEAFTLSYFQAMLVQFAFFGAYFIGSLIYFIISATTGDPIAKMGYKNGVVVGLLIAATGSALFWPGATLLSYPLFLAGLFVVGAGFQFRGHHRGSAGGRLPDLRIFRPLRGARRGFGQNALSHLLHRVPGPG